MGIYTESLRQKEKNDNLAEQLANEALKHNQKGHVAAGQYLNAQTAVKEICRRLGVTAEPAKNCRSVVEMLDCTLDAYQMIYDTISLSGTNWKKQKEYILAFLLDGTPVILEPSLSGYSCVYLHKDAKTKVHVKELQDTAYMIFRPFMRNGFSLKEFVGHVFHMLNLGDILSIVAAVGAVSLLGLAIPKFSQYVLGSVVPLGDGGLKLLPVLFFSYIAIGLIKACVSVVKSQVLGQTRLRISSQINMLMMGRILMMPYDFFRRKSVGKMSFQMRSCKRLSADVLDFVFNNLVSVVFSLIYIPQMAGISKELLLPALIILLAQALINVGLTCFESVNKKRIMQSQEKYEGILFDVLNGIQRINNMGAQKRVYARLANSYKDYLADEFDPPVIVKLNKFIVEVLTTLGTVILLTVAAHNHMSSGDYIAFVASFGLIGSSVSSLVNMSDTAISMRPLIEQMQILFAYEQRTSKETEYVRRMKGNITVSNLSFSYENSEEKVIDNISFHIKSGEKVAFVGESGCGKSTLIKLMLGMLQPTEGRIFYDDKPLESLNKRSLRMRIGSVFQFTQVFPATLAENIAFCCEGATEKDVWEAAEKAAIADDIRRLPMGMETEISEGNGGGFSGGQKQRLMLARVFAQKPSIMILDEATSALDNIVQKKVLDAVYAEPSTVIMIAHRLSTVVNCDQIMMLKGGKIVEAGTYQELMDLNGDFAELVRKQIVEVYSY